MREMTLSSVIVLVLVLLITVLITVLVAILLIILILILITITIEVDHGVLLILILRDEIAHIFVGLLELHLVHALAFVPVQEGLALIHFGELRADALEHALNRRGVGHERAAHRRALGRHRNDGRFDVVRDPRHEVVLHLGLDLGHLVVHLVRRHRSAVRARRRQIFAVL